MRENQFKLKAEGLGAIFSALKKSGYKIIGPTVKEEAAAFGFISSPDDLPRGFSDEQEAGTYRLKKSGENLFFGFANGQRSAKDFLLRHRQELWRAVKTGTGFNVKEEAAPEDKLAFIGVRPCDIAAIKIQDAVLSSGPYADGAYKARRKKSFLIAVDCSKPSAVCFCESMKTGPRAETGFDVALTEISDENGHRFLMRAGSAAGEKFLAKLRFEPAGETEKNAAKAVSEKARAMLKRSLDFASVKATLYSAYDHPRWDETANRCLTCANCTAVCPTCFCVTTEDSTDLAGKTASRVRRLDSCFTLDFTYSHGMGSGRSSVKSRYRQWIIHKLAAWQDQFGTSGCVGCGRCIAWCPAGIDITEEARAAQKP